MADNMQEWLDKLSPYTEGDTPALPAEIADGIRNTWNASSTAFDGATHRITEQDEKITAKDAEIARLKAANYDLTIAASAKPPETLPDPDDHKPTGIASLFTPRGKK